MKIAQLIALPAVLTLALVGGPSEPSGLSFTCSNGGQTATSCNVGQVTFTGTNYNNHVHVVITNQYDDVVEDGFYQAPNGVLNFTEGFFAGTFHVTTTRKGGHDVIDDFYIEITTPSLP